MCIIWVKAAYCGTRDSLTCPTYKMTLLHKKMHTPSMSLNLLYSNPHAKQKVRRASWGLVLCVCPHAIIKRKLPGHSRDVYFWVSLCVCTKDIWHHQPAQLGALTFSKDRVREQKGDESEIEQCTNVTFREQQHTQRARELSEQRGLRMCVASLNSFIPDRMKAHSKQSCHHHTSAKLKKYSQPFSLLCSQVIPKVSFYMALIAVIRLLTVFSKCRKEVHKCYHFPTQRELPPCFS